MARGNGGGNRGRNANVSRDGRGWAPPCNGCGGWGAFGGGCLSWGSCGGGGYGNWGGCGGGGGCGGYYGGQQQIVPMPYPMPYPMPFPQQAAPLLAPNTGCALGGPGTGCALGGPGTGCAGGPGTGCAFAPPVAERDYRLALASLGPYTAPLVGTGAFGDRLLAAWPVLESVRDATSSVRELMPAVQTARDALRRVRESFGAMQSAAAPAAQPFEPAATSEPIAMCPDRSCVVYELGALNNASGQPVRTAQVPDRTPIEVIGDSTGVIALEGASPRRWSHVRLRATDGSTIEGWMKPENLANGAAPAAPVTAGSSTGCACEKLMSSFVQGDEVYVKASMVRLPPGSPMPGALPGGPLTSDPNARLIVTIDHVFPDGLIRGSFDRPDGVRMLGDFPHEAVVGKLSDLLPAGASVGALATLTVRPGQMLRVHRKDIQAAGHFIDPKAGPWPVLVFQVVEDLGRGGVRVDLVGVSDGSTTQRFSGGRYALAKSTIARGMARKVGASDYYGIGTWYRSQGDQARAARYEAAGHAAGARGNV